MIRRLREAAIVLTIVLILLQLSNTKTRLAAASDYASIDVFTQKQPFSGRGQNAQSDAFGPQEVVFLYAEVRTDSNLADNILVAFNVETPRDANFSISARTNSSGIATVNFTISTPPINITENEVFGLWKVIGTILYAGQNFSDTLTFRVDYIVRLLTVRTLTNYNTSQGSFGIGGDVGFEITLRSIAMTLRNATISVLVKDELDFTSNFSLIEDFIVQPNEKQLFIYSKAFLPKSSHIGIATVFVSAFTAPVIDGGVAFCPAISTDFEITTGEPLLINLHDVAVVAVLPSANPVEPNSELELTTLVRNEGTSYENFTVSTYYDEALLGTVYVEGLEPYGVRVFYYSINPTAVTLGNHTIRATIPPVPDEADLTDNDFTATVQVKTSQFTAPHDIAIISVTTSAAQVFAGDPVTIYVNIVNRGNSSETFDLSVYYNSSLIETRNIVGLASLAEISLSFSWNTEFVALGKYQIVASAPLIEDAQPSDNIFNDGFVEILNPPPQAHDVAVLNVVPSSRIVSVGEIVNINVTVKNKGNNTETFYVTAYYEQTAISRALVTALAPSTELNIDFKWNTTGVVPKSYVISAVADAVAGEIHTGDNAFVDGAVTVITPNIFGLPPGILFFVIVLIITGIVSALLLILLLALGRIRRRRPRGVYTVVAHPHI